MIMTVGIMGFGQRKMLVEEEMIGEELRRLTRSSKEKAKARQREKGPANVGAVGSGVILLGSAPFRPKVRARPRVRPVGKEASRLGERVRSPIPHCMGCTISTRDRRGLGSKGIVFRVEALGTQWQSALATRG